MGFSPTDDPAWRHEHVPTGEIRQCATKGCKATWRVTCHNHNRKFCDPCRQGRDRKQTRERKQAARLNSRIRSVLAKKRLSGEITKEELASSIEGMNDEDWWWDDHDYPDDL